MSQVYEFKVVGLESNDEMDEVRMHCKVHPVYSSILFFKLPKGELSKFSIGQIYSLTAQDKPQMIETVPLSSIEPIDNSMDAEGKRWLRDLRSPQVSRFEDGSPVEEAPQSAIERRGGYRL